LDRLALVVLLLAARDGDFELCAVVLEVTLRRDERHAVTLAQPAQPLDLLAAQEELARPLVVVAERRVLEARNAHALHPGLAAAVDVDPRVREVGGVRAERAHLTADESETRFERVFDFVVEKGAAILRDEAVARLYRTLAAGHGGSTMARAGERATREGSVVLPKGLAWCRPGKTGRSFRAHFSAGVLAGRPTRGSKAPDAWTVRVRSRCCPPSFTGLRPTI